MTQRTRNSTGLALLGAVGCLVAAGATFFNVVRTAGLAAAEEPATVPVVREQPAALESAPQQLVPIAELKPPPVARLAPAPLPAATVVSFQRVPAFTKTEAKSEETLNSRLTISFADARLTTALAKLSESIGVSIQLSSGLASEFDATNADETARISADFVEAPLASILRQVVMTALELDQDELTESGMTIEIAPTMTGLEVAIPSIGSVESRTTRIYLIGNLGALAEDRQQIMELLYDKCRCYWKVSTDDGATSIRFNGAVYTSKHDDDVLHLARLAGSMTWLNSINSLVITADAAAHYEIVKTLQLLDEAYQVAGGLQPRSAAQLSASHSAPAR